MRGATHALPHYQNFAEARGSGHAETDVFWVGYLSTAFEPNVGNDGDGSAENKYDTSVGPSLRRPAYQGLAAIDANVGLVYLETAYDQGRKPADLQRALIAAHELGHQFGLSKGKGADADSHRERVKNWWLNLMSNRSFEEDNRGHDSLRLHPLDVAALRMKTHSPGAAG